MMALLRVTTARRALLTIGGVVSLLAAIGAVSCKEVPLTATEGAELSMTANPTSIGARGGVSTITVFGFKSQENGGGPLTDGTQVFLTTDLGVIEERVEMVNGIARASLRADGRSGTATVNARSGAGIAAEPVTVEIGLSGEGLTVTVTANPATLGPLDVTSEITATVNDANGNPIADAPVIFSTTAGALASAGAVLRTNPSGQAFDRLTLLDTADSAQVTATSGSASGTVTVTRGNFGDPILDSVSPFSGAAGTSLTVTINGQRFRAGATASFGEGIAVDNVTYVNSETLRAAIRIDPLSTAGSRTVTVTNADGTTGSLTDGFLVTGGVGSGSVTVTSVSPTDANQGDTLNVTINGVGFIAGAQAGFGAGVAVNSTTFVSATQLTANITVSAAAAAGARDVTVVNPDSTSGTLTGGFNVVAPPIVSAVTPTNGNPGQVIVAVSVDGNNFQSGASVDFGAGITVDQVFFVDPTFLSVDITISGAAAPGVRAVTVTNPDGGTDTLAAGFTVN